MATTLKLGNSNWATKESSLLAYNDENDNFKPLPFTTTRASASSRVNKLGLIENVTNNIATIDYQGNVNGALLTQPQSTNLITYPVSFGNSYWTKSGATIEADKSTAGSELIPNDAGRDFGTNITSESTPYTNFNSAYNPLDLFIYSSPTSISVSSNILNITSSAGTQGIFWKNSHIPTLAGNVYKFSMNVTSVTGTWKLGFYDRTNGYWGDNIEFTTTGVKTLYVFAESSNIEFQLLSSSSGTISVDASPTVNSVKEVQGFTSPSADYTTSAYKLVEDTSTGVHYLIKGLSVSNVNCTFSAYLKKGGRSNVFLSDASTGNGVFFNLDSGVVVSSTGTVVSSKIESYNNDWYRCSFTSLASSLTFSPIIYLISSGTTTSYTGDGTSGVYIYGSQLEQLSYPTSLIYNGVEGSTVTRVADGVADAGNSTVFNSLEGTMYFEGNSSLTSFTYNYFFALSDGTNSNRFEIRQSATNLQFLWRVGGVYQNQIIATGLTLTTNLKLAVKYSSSEISYWINGTEIGTIASPTLFSANTLTELAFDDGSGNNPFQGKCKDIRTYNTALTDSELATLTTI